MKFADFAGILNDLQHKKLSSSMSASVLLDYARIYVALYNLAAGSIGDEYGRCEIYRQRSNDVLKRLMKLYDAKDAVTRRGDILHGIFGILYNTTGYVDRKNEVRCNEWTDEFVCRYIEDFRKDNYNNDELYAVIRVLLLRMYGVVEKDVFFESWKGFINSIFVEWIAKLSSSGRWEEVSENEVLQRLIMLNMNSYMLLDSCYDETIMKVYSAYCRNISLPTGDVADEVILMRMYWLFEVESMLFLPDADKALSERVAEIFYAQYKLLDKNSDLGSKYLSMAIEHTASKILNARQEEIALKMIGAAICS